MDEKPEESTVKDKESTVEDNDPTDAISRLLEATAQECLQEEQEEIKSLVLGENQPDSLMSDMMDRNLTEWFDEQMEAQWEQRLQQVTNDAEVVSKQTDWVM